MVTFAVTLPGASANSLVVTQPNSQSVHEQVAGWFTTQMASRGDHSLHEALLMQVMLTLAPHLPSRTGVGMHHARSSCCTSACIATSFAPASPLHCVISLLAACATSQTDSLLSLNSLVLPQGTRWVQTSPPSCWHPPHLRQVEGAAPPMWVPSWGELWAELWPWLCWRFWLPGLHCDSADGRGSTSR